MRGSVGPGGIRAKNLESDCRPQPALPSAALACTPKLKLEQITGVEHSVNLQESDLALCMGLSLLPNKAIGAEVRLERSFLVHSKNSWLQ